MPITASSGCERHPTRGRRDDRMDSRVRAIEDRFVIIPAGWFLMGSTDGQADEQPVHRVWIDTFEMAAYPVTCERYREFIEAPGIELSALGRLYLRAKTGGPEK